MVIQGRLAAREKESSVAAQAGTGPRPEQTRENASQHFALPSALHFFLFLFCAIDLFPL
jgi:hypothetical protein